MRATTVFVFIAAAFAAVGVHSKETNAERFARGLPPLPPVRRGTPVEGAWTGQPSNTPGKCKSGPVQCCKSLGYASDPTFSTLAGLLGIHLHGLLGESCSPFTSGHKCSTQTVCCKDNSHYGIIVIDCTPVNL